MAAVTGDLTASYAHCEAQLKGEDHDAWLATLFAPAARRPGLHAIGTFAVEAAAVDAAVALGIMDLFTALPRAAGQHSALLPSDVLSRHGATQGDIDAGRVTPAVVSALADLRGVARSRMAALRARRKRLGPAGPAVLTASLVEPRLARTERREPFAIKADLPAWRRQWILWRAARRGGVL